MKPRAGKDRLSGFRNDLYFAADLPTNIAISMYLDASNYATLTLMKKPDENHCCSVDAHFDDG